MTTTEIINAINCRECDESFNTYDVIDFARSKGATIVQEDLDIDRHRWYEISTTVLKGSDNVPFGIRGVTNIYSECMDYFDCDVHVEAFLMEEIKVSTVLYKRKQN